MSRPFRSSRQDKPVRNQEPPAPGSITAIESQARDPERVSIFIDGKFALGLARDVAEQAGLSPGDRLDAAAIEQLVGEESRHRALSTALVYLGHRPRSEGEIRARLRRDGHDADVIEATLKRLRDWRYVDDEDFARRWVENRLEHRPRGARVLASELRGKGIDHDIVSAVMDEADVDEFEGAMELARKRVRQLSGLEPEVRERRLVGYLSRRGYGYDVVRRVLETLDLDTDDHDS